jgi:hypothetical protein
MTTDVVVIGSGAAGLVAACRAPTPAGRCSCWRRPRCSRDVGGLRRRHVDARQPPDGRDLTARACGIDADGLVATIAEVNRHAADGSDPVFGRARARPTATSATSTPVLGLIADRQIRRWSPAVGGDRLA